MAPSQRPIGSARTTISTAVVKLLLAFIAQIPLLHASPLHFSLLSSESKDEKPPAKGPTQVIYLIVALALVLLGGVFAGLTIALMGQVRSSQHGKQQTLTSVRTKYIFKSYKLLERARRGSTQQEFFVY